MIRISDQQAVTEISRSFKTPSRLVDVWLLPLGFALRRWQQRTRKQAGPLKTLRETHWDGHLAVLTDFTRVHDKKSELVVREGGVPLTRFEQMLVEMSFRFAAIDPREDSQGGTLLIGVSDSGEILGLEGDYLSLGGANRDKFELHLRNLLTSSFGTAFVSSKLKVLFPAIGEVEICRIDIQPATKPLVLSVKDKNGIKQEKFYVRSGNSSQELSLTEMPSYLAERFQK